MKRHFNWVGYVETAVKYLLSAITILGGVSSMLAPVTPVSGALGLLYSSRISLVIFGVATIFCGLALLFGTLSHNKKLCGIGLMAVYLVFLFACIFQVAAFGFHPSFWAANAVLGIISGVMWLRWKFKTEYINPSEFRQDIINLKE